MRFSRRLVVALPLILLAWPAAAQALQPGWIADSRTGCRVWNNNPRPQETITWSGNCVGGFAQGSGVLQWFVGGEPSGRYEGEYRDGAENGLGVATWADGTRYQGEWRQGRHQGTGVKTLANGERYEGEFRDGKENGRGTYSWPSGDRYKGDFRDGKFNGHGVMTAANGGRYDGEYRDGKATGRAVYTWPNGDRYEGEFRDAKPNGFGSYVTADQIYNGVWRDGCFRDGDRRAAVGVDLASCP